MRLAEGKTVPGPIGGSGRWCVTVLRSIERVRIAIAAGTLASGLCVCAPALAQDGGSLSADIRERIEGTFALVLGNSPELAIPLTRRALARRSQDISEEPPVDPLAYSESRADDLPEHTAAISPSNEEPDAAPITITSAEAIDPADSDPDIARIPRPRPQDETAETVEAGDTTETDVASIPVEAQLPPEEEAMGGPLDLVAGAAVDEPPPAEPAIQVAAADPQPLLTAHPSGAAQGPAEPNAELVAGGDCLSPSDLTDKDGDFKRNAEKLSGNLFCIAEEKFSERRRKWTIETVKTSRPGPLWVLMHDDEDMSFDTAVEALTSYGGTLLAIETGGKRNLDGIDPNRNFSADGAGCKKLGNDAAPEYTGFIRKLFDPSQPIIALHNNTGERIPTGGLGHVSMDDVPKDMEAHASGDPDGPMAGDRALVLLASPVPVSTTAKARATDLSAKGINALIETVAKGKGDCSLSNFALLSGHEDYLNVTVDADERDKQKQIVDTIMLGHTVVTATQ